MTIILFPTSTQHRPLALTRIVALCHANTSYLFMTFMLPYIAFASAKHFFLSTASVPVLLTVILYILQEGAYAFQYYSPVSSTLLVMYIVFHAESLLGWIKSFWLFFLFMMSPLHHTCSVNIWVMLSRFVF